MLTYTKSKFTFHMGGDHFMKVLHVELWLKVQNKMKVYWLRSGSVAEVDAKGFKNPGQWVPSLSQDVAVASSGRFELVQM